MPLFLFEFRVFAFHPRKIPALQEKVQQSSKIFKGEGWEQGKEPKMSATRLNQKIR